MSKRHKNNPTGTMLDLWRPPRGAGDAIGCLATTYTFGPELFDEQCLARFLEVDSEPNREDIAFLLERETRLGAAYAGVLVDHTQAGVAHSLRWDVLPVRIPNGKQHAKISLLAWAHHVRIIVASANLTKPGYRSNYEIAIAMDLTPKQTVIEHLTETCAFLRSLLAFVSGAAPDEPEIRRAAEFLDQVELQVGGWDRIRQPKSLRQHFVCTLPRCKSNAATDGPGFEAIGSLDETITLCRARGGSPAEAWIASPFFDEDADTDAATSKLCKSMARGTTRRLTFCVPSAGEPDNDAPRLAAPASLLRTPGQYSAVVDFEVLPHLDDDNNSRSWHAKMLALLSDRYVGLMVGSSNFTRAGLGIGPRRNAEANVLTIAECRPNAREPGQLKAVWPEMDKIEDPESAEWQGPKPELDEEERAEAIELPAGFLSARYRAGDDRKLILRLDAEHLPEAWSVHACGREPIIVIDESDWTENGRPEIVDIPWESVQPPEQLRVRWPDGKAFWPLNVEDARQLPPPAGLENMSADDMLLILAASDPGCAFRAWTKDQQPDHPFDEELDTATPPDLDPLRRHDLRTTFLHRIRSRARVLAQLRQNLQRPVWGHQALQWRLEGFIGVKPLAQRFLKDVLEADGRIDELLLALADFLIVLNGVEYEPVDGALPKPKFDRIYRSFLSDLVAEISKKIQVHRKGIGRDVLGFWSQVVKRCQR